MMITDKNEIQHRLSEIIRNREEQFLKIQERKEIEQLEQEFVNSLNFVRYGR